MDRRSFLGAATACVAVGCSTPPGIPSPAPPGSSRGDLLVTTAPRMSAADGSTVELDRIANLVVRRAPDGSTISLAGGFGTGPEQLNGADALALAPNGDCWVLDRGNRRLQRYDRDGTLVHTVEAEHATALAVTPTGALVLAEAVPSRVRTLDERGNELQFFDLDSTPVDVAVRADGEVLVLTRDRRVLLLGATGSVQVVVAGTGLVWPTGIAVDSSGRTVVADAGAFQVVTFEPDGRARGATLLQLDDGRRAQPLMVHGDLAGVVVTVVPGEA